MTPLGLFVVSVLIAAFSRLLAEEIGDWSSWAIRRLIRTAVAWLPDNQRERFSEEWQSHVHEEPGRIGKLCSAVGFLTAAYEMAQTDEHNQIVEGWQQALAELVDCDSKTLEMTNEIEVTRDLPSREEIITMAVELRSLMSQFAELRGDLAARTAKVSCIPTTLTGKLLHGVRIRVLNEEFRDLTQHVQRRTARVNQIRTELRKRMEGRE